MENAKNPLLAKLKLPGRTFQLPSKAALYTNGEVAHPEGEVHVHALSALAEISLKNPDMLLNGSAIDEVFAECVPGVKKPQDLFAKDIDAIMCYMRLVTYGPDYNITWKHSCENAKEHAYMVNIENMVHKTKFLDTTNPDLFKTVLDSGQVVTVQPIKFSHMMQVFQLNANKKDYTVDDIKKNIIFNLVSLVVDVDGIKDKKLIEEWARALTTNQQAAIATVIESSNEWGPLTSAPITCKDCGEVVDVELPLNPISFFTA